MNLDKKKKPVLSELENNQLSNSVESEPQLNNTKEKIMGWIP